MPVHFDTAKTIAPDSLLNEDTDTAAVPGGMHHSKAVKVLGTTGHEAGYLAVGDSVVRVKHTGQHCTVNTSPGSTPSRPQRDT